MGIAHENKGHEIIKALISVIEGTEENVGLLDTIDYYYYGDSDIANINKLIKEAKLFLTEGT